LGFGKRIPDIYGMCGIAGIIQFNPHQDGNSSENLLRSRLKKMADSLEHRGPDGEGFWINSRGQAAFAHRRLAVIDLSPAAGQPMHYLNRYTIVYNGELYNYIELRDRLITLGYSFQTQSDTEVLLAAYDCYREQCLNEFDGMFALVIWDDQEECLFAARDRFGEKPLYYSISDKEFCFASERKALWASGLEKKINFPLLLNYLVLGYTSTPVDKTITYYQDAFSIPPAHYMKLPVDGSSFILKSYWDLDKEARSILPEKEAVEKLRELLEVSVKRRLRSDVSLGTSLSGGLDSSCIVSLMQRIQRGSQPIKTFSAVFPGYERDESSYIRALTDQFKFDNYAITPDAIGLLKEIDRLCYFQEEPFSSTSIYAQYKVFERAEREQVKVLLDGQGADEILAGYNKYIHWWLQELWVKKPFAAATERKALKANGIPFEWGWRNYIAALYPAQVPGFLEKKETRKLKAHPDLNEEFKREYFDRQTIYKPMVTHLNDMLYYNTCQYGLEELLRYADRNSMAHGREVRLPFLNHELVQFVFSLPASYKINNGFTKWILRVSMQDDLPKNIVWRKDKVGFEPPQKSWMENKQLQESMQEAKRTLVQQSILKPSVLDKKIQPQDAHAAENEDWRYLVAATCMRQP
jgi:asparagine synthase (glutamine-hydrolysing)